VAAVKNSRRYLVIACLLPVAALLTTAARSHEPVSQELLAQFAKDGSDQEREARVLRLKQFRMADGMTQRAAYKVRRAALEASGKTAAETTRALTSGPYYSFPFTSHPELLSTGTVKTLTVLVDFKDMRAPGAASGLTADSIRKNIYQGGTPEAAPYESVRDYYRRASQGLLEIQGNVLGWHSLPGNRASYEPVKASAALPPEQRDAQQSLNDNTAIFNILASALDAADATHDFSQYDNDYDGDIDLVTIIYSGKSGNWGSFWWAYRWEFFAPAASTKLFDGLRVKQFVFQDADARAMAPMEFDPTTLIHETGHALGLADYYDYKPGQGPDGGVGGLDMMHANQGNQNAFSRYLLDWIKPTTLGFGQPATRTLNASGSSATSDKAIAIFPDITTSDAPSQEMFIIENRHPIGNDRGLPGRGILIWHIDASVSEGGDDFEYDNSYTPRKLIRLVRADNEADFGEYERATALTYFNSGNAFTPTSSPSSRDYLGRDTRIAIDQIGAPGETMTLRVGFTGPATPLPQPAPPTQAPVDALAVPPTIEAALQLPAVIDLDTLEAIDRALLRTTPAALASQWKANRDTQSVVPENRRTVLRLLASHWAAKDGESAVRALLDLPPEEAALRGEVRSALNAWANSAPSTAARWYLADEQKALRARPDSSLGEFPQLAFAGLYTANSLDAIRGIERLSSARDIMSAVDGILRASTLKGESIEALSAKFLASTPDIARARLQMARAVRDAEKSIKDQAKRREFRDALRQERAE
jgi:M6 family metalloprotease-like protein